MTRRHLPGRKRVKRQVFLALVLGGVSIASSARGQKDSAGHPELILIATGSEVQLAVAAAEKLEAAGRAVRVVSMPCTNVYEQQDAGYRESVLPSDVFARIAIEAAHKDFWYKFVGLDGAIIGMETFGESAPGPQLMEYYGFTADAVVEAANDLLDA